jgi:DNA-binding NarL/FixJ family response regulator
MTDPTRVMIIDDDDAIREGLRLIIDIESDISVVADAASPERAAAIATRLKPDVVITDLNMPGMDGVDVTTALMALDTPPRVLILTSFHLHDRVLDALAAGATGYLLKNIRPGELPEAIRAAASGGSPLSPEIARAVINRAVAPAPVAAETDDSMLDLLTPREVELAAAVGRGLSNADIGTELGLSTPSVKTYVSRTLAKLGFTNRTQLALLAYRAGLLDE